MKNKAIKDIASHKDFPDDCVIAGIFNVEQDKFIVPRGNTNIEANNQLFLVGTRDSVSKAYKVLSKK